LFDDVCQGPCLEHHPPDSAVPWQSRHKSFMRRGKSHNAQSGVSTAGNAGTPNPSVLRQTAFT
jgi:hypothetical protein